MFESSPTTDFGAVYELIKYSTIWGCFIEGELGEQQTGQVSSERADTEITQVPAVRTPVNQHTKWKLQNMTTGLHLMDTCWQEASPVMSRRIPTVLCSSAKKHPNWLTCQARYIHPEGWNHEPSNFTLLKKQPLSCSSSFSAGSQSQLVAGITSTEAQEPG